MPALPKSGLLFFSLPSIVLLSLFLSRPFPSFSPFLLSLFRSCNHVPRHRQRQRRRLCRATLYGFDISPSYALMYTQDRRRFPTTLNAMHRERDVVVSSACLFQFCADPSIPRIHAGELLQPCASLLLLLRVNSGPTKGEIKSRALSPRASRALTRFISFGVT